MARLYIISGCNGAGKTTASYTILPEMLHVDEYVNADEIAERLSPLNPDKESIRAMRLMMEHVYELLEKGKDFSIETTLATKSLARVAEDAKKMGYIVTIFYFWLKSPELAVERVAIRAKSGGHSVPEDTIHRRYYQSIENFKKVYIPICSYWVLMDNSLSKMKMIAEGTPRGAEEIYNRKLYAAIFPEAADPHSKTQSKNTEQ